MKNRDIYELALHLLAEPMSNGRLEDYDVRAPYLLGTFFYENCALDDRYREIFGLGARQYTRSVFVDLEAEFPFAERFVSAAGYYLASALVIDDDEELADKMYDKFSIAMSKIISEIPAVSESIIEIY